MKDREKEQIEQQRKELYNNYLKQAQENNLYDEIEKYYYLTEATIKIFIESVGIVTVYRYLALLENNQMEYYYKIQHNTNSIQLLEFYNGFITKDELYDITDIEYENTYKTLEDFVKELNSLVINNEMYDKKVKVYLKNLYVFENFIYYKHKVKQCENNKYVEKEAYEKILFYEYLQYFLEDSIADLIKNEYNNYLEDITDKGIDDFLYMNKVTYLETDYKEVYKTITKNFKPKEITKIISDFEYNSKQLNYFYLYAVIKYVQSSSNIKDSERTKYKKILTILIINSFSQLHILETLISLSLDYL